MSVRWSEVVGVELIEPSGRRYRARARPRPWWERRIRLSNDLAWVPIVTWRRLRGFVALGIVAGVWATWGWAWAIVAAILLAAWRAASR